LSSESSKKGRRERHPMSRLKEIRERVEKATEGPWVKGTCPDYDVDEIIQTGSRSFSMTGGYAGEQYDHDRGVFVMVEYRESDGTPNCYEDTIAIPEKEQDADFIAEARQDIPYLLSLIDRARECLEKICDMQQKHYGNGMMTHMVLSEMCEEARQLLRELEVG